MCGLRSILIPRTQNLTLLHCPHCLGDAFRDAVTALPPPLKLRLQTALRESSQAAAALLAASANGLGADGVGSGAVGGGGPTSAAASREGLMTPKLPTIQLKSMFALPGKK